MRFPRHLKKTPLFILLGLLLSVAIAWLLGLVADPSTGKPGTFDSFSGDIRWTVTTYRSIGATRIHSTRQRGVNWSPSQATGQPDTPNPGDHVTAWASATTDSQREWLLLDYAKPVTPTRVRIHETYCPGAVNRITAFNSEGQEVTVWQGTDPTPPSARSGVSSIPVSASFATQRIRIHINSPTVAGWNEIDAVGIVDGDGQIHWAVSAQASSFYGQSRFPVPSVNSTVDPPSWLPFSTPTAEFADNTVKYEARTAEARGFPFMALWAEPDPTAPAPAVSSLLSPFTSTSATPILPYRPIPLGLFLNTIIYATLSAVLYVCLSRPIRFVRELSRLRHGNCISCGYHLNYDFRQGCPECGWRRDQVPPPSPRLPG